MKKSLDEFGFGQSTKKKIKTQRLLLVEVLIIITNEFLTINKLFIFLFKLKKYIYHYKFKIAKN